MNKRPWLLALNLVLSHFAAAQSQDFLKPVQTGPFQVNGLSYVEFSLTGPQSGFVDPVNLGAGYSVPTLDQIVSEIKTTGTNLVKINLVLGQMKSPTDNAYDPAIPFPLPGRSNDVIAFGQKLTAQGIPCLMVGQTGLLENRPQPTDRRAFMAQHIPRLVSVAQIAESAGCEYFTLYTDDLEYLAVDSSLVNLWTQGAAQIRTVFSGRLTSGSTWGTDCTSDSAFWTMSRSPQIAALQDVFGVAGFPAITNDADPTVAELVGAYQSNVVGYSSLQGISDLHTLYGKPLLIWDTAFASFPNAAMCHGELALFELQPGNVWPPVDYQAQVNLYQAFFQVVPKLDPAWFQGIVFDSFDRLPYSWKDTHMAAFLGSPGESLRGKPALQTLTQAYRASTPQTVPANGWWYNPAATGTYYVVQAENDVVQLGIVSYSTKGDPQWSLVRCVRRPTDEYVGTAEQYSGGRALNQAATTPPTGIVDGPAITLVFNSAATATLQIGTQSIPIQRYQFSDKWASPMLNAPRAGWWDQPTQSGRGYFLEVQGNTLFMGGLIYTPSGQPTWFTSTGPVDSTGAFSGTLTVCSSSAQGPVCTATADTIRLVFSAPWRATLTLGHEPPVDLRRYRPTEIGWAGPAPAFPLPNTDVPGLSATVNAASYQKGIAPGMIAALFGTGLTRGVNGVVQASSPELPYSIQGTSVMVSGIPAPLYAVANVDGQEQINFQVPWEIRGLNLPGPYTIPAVSIVVINNGAVSPAMYAFFNETFPAIITSDGKQAIAVHADYSLVTSQNPAHSREVITLYGTGFGPVTPLPATGAPAGSSPPSTLQPAPSVTINASDTTVEFAGLSPGSVGLYQFNVVVPDQVGSGNLNVFFTIGGLHPPLVTIPVQ